MKAGVLFSGGKDSSLAALMLSRDYEVELNTFVFSEASDISAVEHAAKELGFLHIVRKFEDTLMPEVFSLITRCGYPNDAINMVHRHAIETLCGVYSVVGDGTRMNDRVPMLERSEVQSLSDRYGCSYVRPLLGFGKREVERLADRYFVVEYGETDVVENGDYERDIRHALLSKGISVKSLFPENHQQSLVVRTRITKD